MWTYRVVLASELFEMPSWWELATTKAKRASQSMQDALNALAKEGWQYVDSCPLMGTICFVFRREQPESSQTGIKTF
jgi:hypothetical protein